MSDRDAAQERPSWSRGATTAPSGTPLAVDVSRDRRARAEWVAFLAAPVIGITHFMVVYLVAEAGCTGEGPGLELFDAPVPAAVTLAATAVAALGCLAVAVFAYRRWRGAEPPADEAAEVAGVLAQRDRGGTLALAGLLLSLLFFATVLFVGLPAPFVAC